jgi:serine/threonine-protein kinase RsbW
MSPTIELKLPINPAFVGVLRQIAGAAAVKADFTIDFLDDLKIACSEAAVLLIQNSLPETSFIWEWTCSTKSVAVAAKAPTSLVNVPDFSEMEGFTWTVLSAVAKDLAIELINGDLVIRFSIHDST